MSKETRPSIVGVQLPISISVIAKRYYLFDIDHISYLRREHNIAGVLSGTLPQACNQNVFLGLPLELMPEEAKLLVGHGVAYLIDDAKLHRRGLQRMSADARVKVNRSLTAQGMAIATQVAEKKQQEKEAALRRKGIVLPSPSAAPTSTTCSTKSVDTSAGADGLFSSAQHASPSTAVQAASTQADTLIPYAITPTTSTLYALAAPPLPLPSYSSDPDLIPVVRASRFALFEYLHSCGYFLSPGLRFGCPFMAYPGDPLRFHSHFLVRPVEEDEAVAVMDLVATGRLGTGVKKGLLVGGLVVAPDQRECSSTSSSIIIDGSKSQAAKKIRCFTLEWSGM